jgi:hypothetical protein
VFKSQFRSLKLFLISLFLCHNFAACLETFLHIKYLHFDRIFFAVFKCTFRFKMTFAEPVRYFDLDHFRSDFNSIQLLLVTSLLLLCSTSNCCSFCRHPGYILFYSHNRSLLHPEASQYIADANESFLPYHLNLL